MFELAVVLTVGSILVAILVGVLIYAVGVYLFHGPVQIVGLIAFIVFILILFGGSSTIN